MAAIRCPTLLIALHAACGDDLRLVCYLADSSTPSAELTHVSGDRIDLLNRCPEPLGPAAVLNAQPVAIKQGVDPSFVLGGAHPGRGGPLTEQPWGFGTGRADLLPHPLGGRAGCAANLHPAPGRVGLGQLEVAWVGVGIHPTRWHGSRCRCSTPGVSLSLDLILGSGRLRRKLRRNLLGDLLDVVCEVGLDPRHHDWLPPTPGDLSPTVVDLVRVGG